MYRAHHARNLEISDWSWCHSVVYYGVQRHTPPSAVYGGSFVDIARDGVSIYLGTKCFTAGMIESCYQ